MSFTYNPLRTRNIYKPDLEKPFKLNRSKIEQFMNCRRYFYLDRRLGIAQPPGFPFNLNSAVDSLLKNEFDTFRESKSPHPIMSESTIKAGPYIHDDLERWRDALHGGIAFHHEDTNLIISGGIDDIWIAEDGTTLFHRRTPR